jgi:hypothetical protein
MANTNNLKPFQSGFDPRRNIKGRPIGAKSIRSKFDEILQRKASDASDKTIQDVLVEKIIKMALDENFQMIKLIWEYRDGKPPKYRGDPVEPAPPRQEDKPLDPETEATIERLFGMRKLLPPPKES